MIGQLQRESDKCSRVFHTQLTNCRASHNCDQISCTCNVLRVRLDEATGNAPLIGEMIKFVGRAELAYLKASGGQFTGETIDMITQSGGFLVITVGCG